MLTDIEPNQTESALLVTIAALLLEPGLIDGDSVDQIAHRLGGEVMLDDLGRRCLSRATARRLVEERREREQRVAEERRKRLEERQPRPAPAAGLPAIEGMSAFETMLAADEDDREPSVHEQLLQGEFATSRQVERAKRRAVNDRKRRIR